MRKKEERLVASFHTTTDAMAMQSACRAEGMRGRLIPVPRQISAGCGLAWSEPAANAEAFYEMVERNQLDFERITSLVL